MFYNVLGVKTLMHQITTTRKRRRLLGDIYTDASLEEMAVITEAEHYLDLRYVYLLALAIAGVKPVEGAPEAILEANIGAESTKFVQVPLDLVTAYHSRATRCCRTMPPEARLKWLESMDTQEGATWVHLFRNSDDTLGKVIKEVMMQRYLHWEVRLEIQAPPPQMARERLAQPAVSGGKGLLALEAPQAAIPRPGHYKLGHTCVATQFRDGTKLCDLFQKGVCSKGAQCTRGKHQCGFIKQPGARPCGSPNHGAGTHIDKA